MQNNEAEGYKAPPWSIFDRKDGTADILPAMRRGVVLANIPKGLADVLVTAANDYLHAKIRNTQEAGENIVDLMQQLAECFKKEHP